MMHCKSNSGVECYNYIRDISIQFQDRCNSLRIHKVQIRGDVKG